MMRAEEIVVSKAQEGGPPSIEELTVQVEERWPRETEDRNNGTERRVT